MSIRTAQILVFMTLGTVSLVQGCGGQRHRSAGERVGDAVEEAGDDIEDATDEATD
jgi:hypothetical protein